MTSRERLTAALAGQPVDHVPFSPFLAYVWEHFADAVQRAGQLSFLTSIGADPMWRGAPCPVKAEVEGITVRTQTTGELIREVTETPVGTLEATWKKSGNANTAFLIGHPVRAPEHFKIQLWIEEHTRFVRDPNPVEEHFRGDGREGLSVGMLIPRLKTAYQSLIEHHVGTEELAYARVDHPELVDALVGAMTANDVAAARMAVDSPYDYFLTWEDSSTQNYSPDDYRRYISPEIRAFVRLLGNAGKHYIQHACGHLRALLPLMREDGVAAVESLSPEPTGNISVADARRTLGGAAGIIGGIEPTHLLNLPDTELDDYVHSVIEEAHGGPFVLANSDSCPPGVTPERFARVAALAREIPF